MNLFEINEQYKAVLSDLESMDELDEQTIQDTLAPYREDLDKKCLAVGAFIKNLDAEAKAVKDVEAGLTARRRTLENKSKRLRNYLAMNLPGKVKDANVSISPKKGSDKVVIDDESKLPEEFVRVERKPILTEIKKHIESLSGAAHLEEGPPSVTIR